jgi:heterodisulfide reductase subunit A
MRAVRLMHPGSILAEPITSEVVEEHCRACGKCAEVCPYRAITVDVKRKVKASVNSAACMGCGACAAECRFGAITMNHFTDLQILDQIDTLLADKPHEKVLAFACNWCSYAGADFAGISRIQYPPSVHLIRTMCSGRVSEKFLWHGFRQGAPVILVSGCHINDCHYINANNWTEKRVQRVRTKMEKLGLRPERLQLQWISAAEGALFARTMRSMEELRLSVSTEEIAGTVSLLAEKPSGRESEGGLPA